ncbi:MAG: class I SAM-dependent methyltransferase [Beijerinckiaceae bacterium]|nr:class I SAM-dependent methyltransferase [Beijerinckiaceae bacterium]
MTFSNNDMSPSSARDLQRAYYTRTATEYDDQQVYEGSEHEIALVLLAGFIERRGYASVLDVGSGTGRALRYLKRIDGLYVQGVEPVAELRECGYANGIAQTELIDGDALNLAYPDGSFDLVCCFGVLHHIEDHKRVVAEMCASPVTPSSYPTPIISDRDDPSPGRSSKFCAHSASGPCSITSARAVRAITTVKATASFIRTRSSTTFRSSARAFPIFTG